jgi:poly(3-hydroxybutyrate) depolymerase
MIYQAHALAMEVMQPFRQTAKTLRYFSSHPFNPFRDSFLIRHGNAGLELFERLTAYYEKPRFGINQTVIGDKQVTVREEVVMSHAYCDLLHFRKETTERQPKLLMVAPLSGHYSTLLRNTVKRLLPDNDIYITDWRSAREVPLADGEFHLDDYVEYVIHFLSYMGGGVHVMAVCQPVVPVLAAIAVMSMVDNPNLPASAILISGPVDARINPSEVNDYTSNRDYEWFENNLIFKVPHGYIGEGQPVYPGFVQLSGFLSLNLNTHIAKHYHFYRDLVRNDGDSSEEHRKFYNEYLAVLDISAPFYLETIKRVFMECELANNAATYRGSKVDLDAISKTALFTIEGGRDDICGLGQTEAAQAICPNIPKSMRRHHVEADVGHYGAFNGRHFRESVAPQINDFILKHTLPH